ncbi:MAG: electron transport complex subunit RsxB [Burkholderiaceae bacterium]|nr:electron transport complex subunit RsxB [Burkholderiaceae bacterium]
MAVRPAARPLGTAAAGSAADLHVQGDLTRIEAIDRALPQTQCTRCGYPDCRSYAQAIADGSAAINRCPPGGEEGIARLAAITGAAVQPLDESRGLEAPRRLAVIDEAGCIGCTLCLPACPVDCIIGGPKAMHTIIDALCTGCELCLPACPVDCISLVDLTGERTGWAAWSLPQADEARARYSFHQFRLQRDRSDRNERLEARALTLRPLDIEATPTETTATSSDAEAAAPDRRRAVIEAAMARARAARLP